MSVSDVHSSQRQTIRSRRQADSKKLAVTSANLEIAVPEESMADAIAQSVTEKISSLMELKFSELQTALNGLTSRIEDNSKRLTEAENRISENEDRTNSLENKVALLEKKVQSLSDRAEDIENRCRRDNIRIIGLKEGIEGKQVVRFFASWLHDTLGLETKRGSIKIDRAHRALGPRKANYNRPVIIKLHNYSDKQRILAAAKEKGDIFYQGSKVFIRQDLSAAVREARRRFNDICERLLEKKIRFQMRYPATLSITVQGKDHSFKTPKEAVEFLSRCDFTEATTEETD